MIFKFRFPFVSNFSHCSKIHGKNDQIFQELMRQCLKERCYEKEIDENVNNIRDSNNSLAKLYLFLLLPIFCLQILLPVSDRQYFTFNLSTSWTLLLIHHFKYFTSIIQNSNILLGKFHFLYPTSNILHPTSYSQDTITNILLPIAYFWYSDF